jgi:hypothetical protein
MQPFVLDALNYMEGSGYSMLVGGDRQGGSGTRRMAGNVATLSNVRGD